MAVDAQNAGSGNGHCLDRMLRDEHHYFRHSGLRGRRCWCSRLCLHGSGHQSHCLSRPWTAWAAISDSGKGTWIRDEERRNTKGIVLKTECDWSEGIRNEELTNGHTSTVHKRCVHDDGVNAPSYGLCGRTGFTSLSRRRRMRRSRKWLDLPVPCGRLLGG